MSEEDFVKWIDFPETVRTGFRIGIANYLCNGDLDNMVRPMVENNLYDMVDSCNSVTYPSDPYNSYKINLTIEGDALSALEWIRTTAPTLSWGNDILVQDWVDDKDGRRTEYVKELRENYIIGRLQKSYSE